MPSAPSFWLDDPDSWDRVTIRDPFGDFFALPGLSKVTVKAPIRINITPSPLYDGATYVPQGLEPQSVEITTVVYTAAQWVGWTTILPLLRPPAPPVPTSGSFASVPTARRPYAYVIDHPATQLHGVQNIIIREISGPDGDEQGGYKTMKISATAYRPMRPLPGYSISGQGPASVDFGSVPGQAITINPAPDTTAPVAPRR